LGIIVSRVLITVGRVSGNMVNPSFFQLNTTSFEATDSP
jgi:hypothetical protein